MFAVATSWWGIDIAVYQNRLRTILGQQASWGEETAGRVRIAQQYLPLLNASAFHLEPDIVGKGLKELTSVDGMSCDVMVANSTA